MVANTEQMFYNLISQKNIKNMNIFVRLGEIGNDILIFGISCSTLKENRVSGESTKGKIMAEKKVYFYAINLYEVDGERLLPITRLKPLIEEIISTKATQLKEYKTLDLTTNVDDELHIMMDVFDYENEKLFCRLSKQRPYNSLMRRDYVTSECSDVVSQNEIGNKGIEIFTYGRLDYNTGIFAYVSAQSAPSEKALISLFEKYNNRYKIEMVSIPNTDAIDTIYYGNNPQISKIEIEIPRPDADIMQQVFKWDDPDVTAAVSQNAIKAEIVVYSPVRENLVNNDDAVRVIDKLRAFSQAYKNVKLTAKANGSRLREYDLYARFFSYPIDIPKYHMFNNKRVEYTIEQLVDMYRQNLHEAFETNRTILTTLTGRDN